MSFNDMHLLQACVMAKLSDMIGDLNRKIALLTIATICPQRSLLDSTTTALTIPFTRPLLYGTWLSPQQYTALGILKPQGSFVTLHAPIL